MVNADWNPTEFDKQDAADDVYGWVLKDHWRGDGAHEVWHYEMFEQVVASVKKQDGGLELENGRQLLERCCRQAVERWDWETWAEWKERL